MATDSVDLGATVGTGNAMALVQSAMSELVLGSCAAAVSRRWRPRRPALALVVSSNTWVVVRHRPSHCHHSPPSTNLRKRPAACPARRRAAQAHGRTSPFARPAPTSPGPPCADMVRGPETFPERSLRSTTDGPDHRYARRPAPPPCRAHGGGVRQRSCAPRSTTDRPEMFRPARRGRRESFFEFLATLC